MYLCGACTSPLYDALEAPSYMRTPFASNSNGYSHAESLPQPDGDWSAHTSYAMFEVKQIMLNLTRECKDYRWNRISFASRWKDAKRNIVLFFETPSLAASKYLNPSTLTHHARYAADPFWIHTLVTQEIVWLQEESVWAVRDKVRVFEKERVNLSQGDRTDYGRFQDVDRHAIHSCESLETGALNSSSIVSQHSEFCQTQAIAAAFKDPATQAALIYVSNQLSLHSRLLQSLKARADSNKERLRNELAMVINRVAEHNASVSTMVSRAVLVDSAAMKAISILGMFYLPSTFLSSIFSSTFFEFTPATDSQGEEFKVSNHFWLFWVFAIPLTVVTIGGFQLWTRFWTRSAWQSAEKKARVANLVELSRF